MRSCTLLVATAATALWTATALASTYYVSPAGSSANPGTPAAPWSLAKANSSLVAGDVALLLPGNYGSTPIAPANSGNSYAAFIAYVGDLAQPASTVVTGVTLASRPYVSVKGVQVNSTTTFTAAHDSLAWCVSPLGTISIQLGGDDCVVANSAFAGSKIAFNGGTNGPTASTVKRDTVDNCAFHLDLDGYGPAIYINATDQLALLRSRFIVTVGSNGDHGTIKLYGCRNGRFTDCFFDITNNRTTSCDECGLGYIRDYTIQTVFLRDTLIFRAGAGPMNELLMSASGSFPGTVVGNRYDGCTFIQEHSVSTGALYWQNGAQADTIRNTVVVSAAGTPIEMSGFSQNSLVSHNTFVYLGSNGHAGDTYAGGAFNWGSTCQVRDNIFYAPAGRSYAYGVDQVGNYAGNHNLLYNGTGASTSLKWNSSSTAPGASGTACTSNAQECQSLYADPRLVGGSSVFGFDPHLGAGSPAIGVASDGGDIGALPFGTAGTDIVPPAPINDLSVEQTDDNNVQLTWSATGDDSTSGVAASYELRVSSQPITDANFGSATTVSIALTPQAPGVRESFVVDGLTPGTVYYFAVRALDDAANAGHVSNSPSTTTLATDTVAPPQTKDFTVSPP